MTEPGRYTAADYERLREIENEFDLIRQQERERAHFHLDEPTRTRIEPTSSGYGVIRTRTERMTKEQMLAREKYLRDKAMERARRERAKGHTFTRRTYRKAMVRAERRFLELIDSADADVDQIWQASAVIARITGRGRREKGMWCA